MEYLIDEILIHQPEEIQIFLTQSSIFERFCSSLCDHVIKERKRSSLDIISYIDKSNIFLIPLDDERKWFRFHHLFHDLLRQKLQQRASTEQIEKLHENASIWFEENLYTAESIHHALASGNIKRSAKLIECSWLEMDKTFQAGIWLKWAKSLPEQIIKKRPVLCVECAWACIDTGRIKECETWIQAAEACLVNPKDRNVTFISDDIIFDDENLLQNLPFRIASARSSIAQANDDISISLKYAKEAVKLVDVNDSFSLGSATGILATSYWANGNFDKARKYFYKTIQTWKSAGNILFTLAVKSLGLTMITFSQGKFNETEELYREGLKDINESGESVFILLPSVYIGMSELHIVRGEYDKAQSYMSKSREAANSYNTLTDWKYRLSEVGGRLFELEEKYDKALEKINEAERFHVHSSASFIKPYEAMKIRIYLKQGRFEEAENWITTKELNVENDIPFNKEYDYITLARILSALYENNGKNSTLQKALTLLEKLKTAAIQGNRTASSIEINILFALLYDLDNDEEQTIDSLKSALSLAEEENALHPFISEGSRLMSLLSELRDKGIKSHFIDKIISAFENIGSSNSQGLVEPLSERELEILRMIGEGLSNQDIGSRLSLALNTIKGYNQNIFGKLGVSRRTEAVAKARELGIIK